MNRTGHGGLVTFTDLGLSDGFVADLRLDPDGLVIDYPHLARLATIK